MRPTGKFGQNPEMNSDLSGVKSLERKSIVEALSAPRLRTIKFNNFNFVVRGIPDNTINNQRYTFFSFLPMILFDQFRYFFNFFFLIICLSQFVEPLRVGFLISYLAPLIFVLSITIIKEMYEDYLRGQRDKALNEKEY